MEKITKTEKSKIGKKSRADGKKWELVVRKDLESKGWVVDRWTNQVEHNESSNPLEWEGGMKLVPAKAKFNPYTKSLMMGSGGFPDFIAFAKNNQTKESYAIFDDKYGVKSDYSIIGVESKINGNLDKEEKEKCQWLLANNIFSIILVASKGVGKDIIYKEFDVTTNKLV